MNGTIETLSMYYLKCSAMKHLKCLLILLISISAVCSCNSNSDEKYGIPSGQEVTFNVGNAGNSTKASYSGSVTGGVERIDWQKDDRLRMFCDAVSEPESGWADYTVLSDGSPNDNVSSACIAATGGIGLRWGTGKHVFYGVFPAPGDGIATDISRDMGDSFTPHHVIVSANLASAQAVTGDILKNSAGTFVAAPDLKNLLMVAKSAEYDPGAMSAGTKVILNFKPLTTAILFTVTNGTGDVMELSSVSLICGNGKSSAVPLNGPFEVDADVSPLAASGETETEDMQLRTNTIAFAQPVRLEQNERLSFTFFLLPVSDYDDLTFRFTRSDGSSMSTRLGYTDGSGIFFPKFKKSEVTGLLLPATARWTIRYAPEISSWNGGEELPIAMTAETPWDIGN